MPPITDAHPDLDRKLAFFPIRNDDPQCLSREQVAQYNTKGFIFPLDVFSLEEAQAHRVYFDDLMARAEARGLWWF